MLSHALLQMKNFSDLKSNDDLYPSTNVNVFGFVLLHVLSLCELIFWDFGNSDLDEWVWSV